MRRFIVLAALCFALPAHAVTIINNGLAPPNPANIINTLIPESVFVQNSSSGNPTTVEMDDGGQVGDETGERFEGFGSSILLMSGGYIADDIFTHDSATLHMTGGLVNSGVLAFGSSELFVNGGTIESGLSVSSASATALITGGSVTSVSSAGVATITGGTDLYAIDAGGEGTVNVVGGSFAVNGETVGFGEIPASYGKTGTLTGVLQSGESFSVLFTRAIDTGDHLNPIITGKIVLIPEPATALLLAAGLAGLAAAGRRRSPRLHTPKRPLVLFPAVLLATAVHPSGARAITFDDGLAHTVNSAYAWIDVYDGPGATSTTVSIENGAIITRDVTSYDTSLVNMNGGAALFNVNAKQNSVLTFSGGLVDRILWASEDATLNMFGGEVGMDLRSYDNSVVNMSGGLLVSNLRAFGNSHSNISGGEIGGFLQAYNSSTITMSGGTVTTELSAVHSSTIIIVGRGFEVDGIPVPHGDLTALTGTLTGTLLSGDPINNVFYQGYQEEGSYTGTIHLAQIPEPSTALLVATGLAGLAATGRRRSLH